MVVGDRARWQCEYCQAQQNIVVSMVVDHIVPVSAGGETVPENLCFSCVSCNSYKLNFETGQDPDLKLETRLYNPRSDRWEEHFRWSDDSSEIVGLTSVGRATITRLNMNQPTMLIARREWKKTGLHPPPESTFHGKLAR